MKNKNILVLGVGNLLLSDEGVGIHVVSQLRNMHLAPNVEVIDGGTRSFELIEHFRNRKKVIIVDAVNDASAEPGTVFRFTPDDAELQWFPAFSAHQLSLYELLNFAQQLEPPPEIIVYGIVPKETKKLSTHLSRKVKRRIHRIISEIFKEIQ